MATKIPVLDGEQRYSIARAYGYDPELSSLSPYKGAMAAGHSTDVKTRCAGIDPKHAWLSFQELLWTHWR